MMLHEAHHFSEKNQIGEYQKFVLLDPKQVSDIPLHFTNSKKQARCKKIVPTFTAGGPTVGWTCRSMNDTPSDKVSHDSDLLPCLRSISFGKNLKKWFEQ